MRGTPELSTGTQLQAVSNALVRLHKEQFGRGPTSARSYFAGPDTLVCTLEDTLLPAERTMVEMGERQRVRESRLFLQVASQDQFVAAIEALVSRKVRAFAGAIDPAPVSCSKSSASNPKTHTATDPRRYRTRRTRIARTHDQLGRGRAHELEPQLPAAAARDMMWPVRAAPNARQELGDRARSGSASYGGA